MHFQRCGRLIHKWVTFPSYDDFFSLPSKAVARENLLAASTPPVASTGTAIRCQAALYQDCHWTSQGSDNCIYATGKKSVMHVTSFPCHQSVHYSFTAYWYKGVIQWNKSYIQNTRGMLNNTELSIYSKM